MAFFKWRQDKFDKCCWFVSYKNNYSGCVCKNGISAYQGRAIYHDGNLKQRKKSFEKLILREEKIDKYRESLED